MNTTSPSLLERLRQPAEEESWGRFVKLYTPLLFSWARRMGLQEQDAADLVQDVLTLLVQKLPEFRYDQSKTFRGWLHTLTLNRWRELRRRAGAAPAVGGAADLADVPSPTKDEAFWEQECRQYLVGRALQLMQADFQPTTWKEGTAALCGAVGVDSCPRRLGGWATGPRRWRQQQGRQFYSG
jgi:RNA polymerase sigma-70 factor, ECF subfamily